MYREFSLAYMQRIVDGLTREADGKKIPVVLFTKNGGAWLDAMADTGCDGLGVDWTMDLADARRLTGDRVALQGNLDPSTLYGTPERIRDDVKRVLESYGDGPGHVFNLGHGIHQHVNPDHLGVMVDAVKEFSAR
jgi:uroporphyrinogen decarboxylase